MQPSFCGCKVTCLWFMLVDDLLLMIIREFVIVIDYMQTHGLEIITGSLFNWKTEKSKKLYLNYAILN